MISAIVSRLVILVFGTLYPAYASYKAVRTKNVKEYVKWMMYWIVFALFTCAETFTDVFLSFWFPFYYEIKIILVVWLLSPATKGSSILYRKFVHPMLSRREQDIDEYIAKAKEQGYHTVLHLGTKGVNYATNVIMQTAIKNLNSAAPSISERHLRATTDGIDSISEIQCESTSSTSTIDKLTRSQPKMYFQPPIDVLEISEDEMDLLSFTPPQSFPEQMDSDEIKKEDKPVVVEKIKPRKGRRGRPKKIVDDD